MFILPPNSEIRSRYSIPNDTFSASVVTQLPSPKELNEEECFLVKVADFFGVPTFLKKTKGLIVIAIFFLPAWGPNVLHSVQDSVIVSYEYWLGPFQNRPIQKEEAARYVFAIPPSLHSGPTGPIDLRSGQFPNGAIIAGATGVMNPNA